MMVKIVVGQTPTRLQDGFDHLFYFRIRLNLLKCSLGPTSGKFPGYLLTKGGIKSNPDQLRAPLEMPTPKNIDNIMSH